ncbi:MAG: ATP-binding cassette domain-containing protein [Spirochaetaceae bacterium]|nr:MAG: ATP-binding cassette domain-containing protein [Spirochaetaceae bacterium]
MIEVTNLTKRYGKHLAVDSVNFSVSKGEVVGFLGPNGAGKSTTMNILTGYLSATEGDVFVDGVNILEEPEAVKSRIGYLPETPPIYPEMTVREYLRFVCRIKHVPKTEMKDRIESGLHTVGIVEVYNRLIGNLSKGYRQRVGLAQALMGNPEILILDEPTSGLDPKQIIEIRELIRKLGADRTVVLSSHILPEVSEICRRVMIINNGRIVADGDPTTIGGDLFDASQIVVTALGDEQTVRSILSAIPGVTNIQPQPTAEQATEVLVESEKNADLRKAIFEAFSSRKVPLIGLRVKNATLEEIFLELTSGVREAE